MSKKSAKAKGAKATVKIRDLESKKNPKGGRRAGDKPLED